jgi:predicted transcriptional regulator
MTQKSPLNYLELTTDLVSAYISHNSLPSITVVIFV